MCDDTRDPSDVRSTAHIRPFVHGQILTPEVLNELIEAMRHLDGRLTDLEKFKGIDVLPLAPPFDPNESPLPLPEGDFEPDLEH